MKWLIHFWIAEQCCHERHPHNGSSMKDHSCECVLFFFSVTHTHTGTHSFLFCGWLIVISQGEMNLLLPKRGHTLSQTFSPGRRAHKCSLNLSGAAETLGKFWSTSLTLQDELRDYECCYNFRRQNCEQHSLHLYLSFVCWLRRFFISSGKSERISSTMS